MERALRPKLFRLDTRAYDAARSAAFVALRREVADGVWSQVPGWRAAGVPIAFQPTGDKSHLPRGDVSRRSAGDSLRIE